MHGVWNDHPAQSRIHLICDFLASPVLLDLLARGERDLGSKYPEVRQHFIDMTHRVTATDQ